MINIEKCDIPFRSFSSEINLDWRYFNCYIISLEIRIICDIKKNENALKPLIINYVYGFVPTELNYILFNR